MCTESKCFMWIKTAPSTTLRPAGLWPPFLTDTRRPCSRAKRSAAPTPSVLRGRMTNAGCCWYLALNTAMVSEKLGSPGHSTSPATSCRSLARTGAAARLQMLMPSTSKRLGTSSRGESAFATTAACACLRVASPTRCAAAPPVSDNGRPSPKARGRGICPAGRAPGSPLCGTRLRAAMSSTRATTTAVWRREEELAAPRTGLLFGLSTTFRAGTGGPTEPRASNRAEAIAGGPWHCAPERQVDDGAARYKR
mmetsp:Transcript_28944/g.72646  ORF Transcript_28944/g.72646 Transcript_28944/m.72646 type:complete len:252 (+) Transcript_28944:561-1316(+)